MNLRELERLKKQIKKIIEDKIVSTTKSIKEYSKATKPISPENAIGRVSRMDAINNKSVVELALKKSQEKLKQLNWVKKNINTENFGVCIRCNQNIPIERLLIVPEIPKCVGCSR